jgi:membrane protease YdiL (CAAX protease family)
VDEPPPPAPPPPPEPPPLPEPSLPVATALEPAGVHRRQLPWTLIAFIGLALGNYGGLIVVTDKLIIPGVLDQRLGAAGDPIGAVLIAIGAVLAVLGVRRAMVGTPDRWIAPAWLPPPMSWVAEFAHWAFVRQWRLIDADTPPPPPGEERRLFDPVILVILVVAAVSLTLQEYLGDRGEFSRWFPLRGRQDEYYELKSFGWWSGWRVLGYLILPILVVLVLPKQRVRDYHISPRGFFHHMPIYLVLFLLILPAVIAASGTKSFQHTYPFYKLANRSTFDLVAWELMYAAQFLSLEFFFRGFLLEGLRSRMGSNAIFVMIVPYCMIHYGKPLPETMGAIGAGVILGTLAMRTRSIWGGVLIHIAVATTMDVMALEACPPMGRPCGY